MTLFYKEMDSIVGKLKLIANDKALVAILWEHDKPNRVKLGAMTCDKYHPILKMTENQLEEYFDSQRTAFNVPLELIGTDFQKEVWKQLNGIPYGMTWSYGELAKKIGNPNASRAVGAAVGRNPISIIIPCHRVLGTNGKLTGFAGGLHAKETLLKLESIQRIARE